MISRIHVNEIDVLILRDAGPLHGIYSLQGERITGFYCFEPNSTQELALQAMSRIAPFSEAALDALSEQIIPNGSDSSPYAYGARQRVEDIRADLRAVSDHILTTPEMLGHLRDIVDRDVAPTYSAKMRKSDSAEYARGERHVAIAALALVIHGHRAHMATQACLDSDSALADLRSWSAPGE